MRITTVILDLDDTLFMTQAVSFEMENAAAVRLGYQPMSREVHLSTWGVPIEEAIPLRIPGIDVAAFLDEHANVISEYASAGKLDKLSEKNLAALTALTRSGYRLFVLTSRHAGEVRHFMDGNHVLQRFLSSDAIYHKSINPYHKPDPRVFDVILQAASASPGQCVYVGDTISDCQAAKGAGLQFVACLESGLRRREDFAALTPPPNGFIDTFAGITEWLRTNS
jgi:phosphoglycolate phosphatase